MARIIDIKNRSNQWVNNFGLNVVRVIEGIDQKTVDFNRAQMLASKNAGGSPLIHNRTGSAKLSAAYAKRTGKTRPNIFISGEFQSSMFLVMNDEKEYFITSDNYLVRYLPTNYDKLFGISPQNQPKAQKINDKAIIDDYLKSVFR